MKRLMIILAALLLMLPEIHAKPKAHVEISFDVEIGRPRKGCKMIWLCFANEDVDITIEPGAVKNNNHSIVLDDDGSLFIAIEMAKIRKQDFEKFKILELGKIELDSEETLPPKMLAGLGYSGSNVFRAGTYPVTKADNYFMIRLN